MYYGNGEKSEYSYFEKLCRQNVHARIPKGTRGVARIFQGKGGKSHPGYLRFVISKFMLCSSKSYIVSDVQ